MSYAFCVSVEDAIKKWCPVSLTAYAGIAINRATINVRRDHASDVISDTRCIADDCMAWRWVETHIKDESGSLTVLSGDTHGFCGLAGNPWKKGVEP